MLLLVNLLCMEARATLSKGKFRYKEERKKDKTTLFYLLRKSHSKWKIKINLQINLPRMTFISDMLYF